MLYGNNMWVSLICLEPKVSKEVGALKGLARSALPGIDRGEGITD